MQNRDYGRESYCMMQGMTIAFAWVPFIFISAIEAGIALTVLALMWGLGMTVHAMWRIIEAIGRDE